MFCEFYNIFNKVKNMEGTIPTQPKGFIAPPMGQQFPQGGVPPMGLPQGPQRFPGPFPYPPMYSTLEGSMKVNEFKRAVFVSGFEPSMTAIMLLEHFKIKPIDGLKLPMSKFENNKGYAFIYYKSADDAAYVKEKLDHTVILRNEIRVTKACVANNLSKIMIKLKTNGLNEQEINDVKARFFNEKALENEISKIIQSLNTDLIEVNKVIIPKSKNAPHNRLNYARCFFYISDARRAKGILRNTAVLPTPGSGSQEDGKEPYKFVLEKIVEKLNENPDFSKHAKAEVYVYSETKKSSVVHLKNIAIKPDEDLSVTKKELQELISNQNKQWNIKDCYVGRFNGTTGWATLSFETHEEAKQVYEFFKNNDTKFRDQAIYGNLTNTVDERTVVISPVKPEVTEALMRQFLNRLAESSPKVDGTNEAKGRKYDFVSFNILDETTIVDIGNGKYIPIYKTEELKSWHRIHHKLPRRVVVHFKNDIPDREMNTLNSDVKLASENANIFDLTTITTKHALKGNHPKGHIDRHTGLYVKHHNLPKEKRDREAPRMTRNPRTEPRRPEAAMYNRPQRPGPPRFNGVPNMPRKDMGPNFSRGHPQMGNRPMGSIPTMGGNRPVGNIPVPVMGMQPPQMGQIPKMGMVPPPMGMVPPMGMAPPMGGMVPPMGAPGMGMQVPKMGGNPGVVPPKQ